MRGVVARRAGDAAAGMGAGAAHIEAGDRAAIVAVTEDGPCREHLIEFEAAMHDVAAEETETALEIERGQRFVTQHRSRETRREPIDGGDHELRDCVAMLIPALA